MNLFRRALRDRFTGLMPLAAALCLLTACGGGGPDGTAAPGPTPPSGPAAPGTPVPPATSVPPPPVVQLDAAAGSSQHATLTWAGGSVGTRWRLERRPEAGGDYAPAAEVDSVAGVWADSGLRAETTYAYRLVRADGSTLASASVRTGAEPVLLTPEPGVVGAAQALPLTPTTRRLALADGSLALDLPAGSFADAGTAQLQPVANPLPDGVGPGLSLSLPQRPAQPLTLHLRYDAAEDVDEVLQDRIALRQADGSWWLLPLAGHDASQRLIQVVLPTSLWTAPPTASAQMARRAANVPGVKGTFVRVRAHKLLPASATVRVLGSRRFVPVSIYVMSENTSCATSDPADLCIPTPVLKDVQLPIRNGRAGFQRSWTLDGGSTPAPAVGTLAVEPQSGAVYTAPATVPANNPVTLRFRSVNSRTGQQLVLSARIRVTEDAWVGTLLTTLGDVTASHRYLITARWQLDGAQSSATRRVYRAAGGVAHEYVVLDPVCQHAVAPSGVTLTQARSAGELVVDESTQPARYALTLSAHWDSILTVVCPTGSTSGGTVSANLWQVEGAVGAGEVIQGESSQLVHQVWSLGRPQ